MTNKIPHWFYCRHCKKQYLRDDYEIVRTNKESKKYFGVCKCNLCEKKMALMLKKDFVEMVILSKNNLN